jgi:hypothetical protein
MDNELELPKYKCHKVVNAAKILEINDARGGEDKKEFVLEVGKNKKGEIEKSSVLIFKEWIVKHEPKVGGYYVVYDNGYSSWSPADAFEEGYDLLDKKDSKK